MSGNHFAPRHADLPPHPPAESSAGVPASHPRSSSIGATVTAVRSVHSDPNLQTVAVAGRMVATLPVAEVERLGLKVGQIWSAELDERVDHLVQSADARRRALRALGRRAHSRTELIQHLQKHGHQPSIAKEIVDELTDNGWIDEASLAAECCRTALAKGPLARRRLAEKLLARGLDRSLAERASRAALSNAQELEGARALLRQRLAAVGLPVPASAVRRAAAVLSRRGFEDDTIAHVLDESGLLESQKDADPVQEVFRCPS